MGVKSKMSRNRIFPVFSASGILFISVLHSNPPPPTPILYRIYAHRFVLRYLSCSSLFFSAPATPEASNLPNCLPLSNTLMAALVGESQDAGCRQHFKNIKNCLFTSVWTCIYFVRVFIFSMCAYELRMHIGIEKDVF